MTKSRSPSPEINPLDLGTDTDIAPLPAYKAATTSTENFSGLLSTPLVIHEDLKTGCGGQLWPAGMVLATHMLRYHRSSLRHDKILELGAGGGLVGLAVSLGCEIENSIYITDQENMMSLMTKNVELNHLEGKVKPLILNWGEPLPADVQQQKPTVILAADCVYFEPAFPLLISTLEDLFEVSEDAVVYFCFKKRRRADLQFIKNARKKFVIEDVEDQGREVFSREGLYLYTFKKKNKKLS